MKNKRGRLFNIILFLVVLIFTITIVLKINDKTLIIKNLRNINLNYFFLAFLCMSVYLILDGIITGVVLKSFNLKIKAINLIKYSCVSFFFSGITPSSTGGEPMKLYTMKKDKLPLPESTLSILLALACYIFTSCILGFIGVIVNFNILKISGFMKYMVLLGFIINTLYVLLLLTLILSKKTAIKILNILNKLLNKIHYKNRENLIKKINNQIDKYHECSVYIKNNKKVIFKIIMITILELIIYNTIPYLICLSLGIHNLNPLKVITMNAVLHVSVSFFPFPGAMGANEGGFMFLYKFFIQKQFLPSIMIITRMVNYYLFIILTSIVVLITMLKKRK